MKGGEAGSYSGNNDAYKRPRRDDDGGFSIPDNRGDAGNSGPTY